MEQQRRQKRQSDPLRFQYSSSPETPKSPQPPAAFGSSRVRAGSTSNKFDVAAPLLESMPLSPDEQNVQSRRLQARQARFRGLAIAPRKVTPLMGTAPVKVNQDTSTLEPLSSSPFDIGFQAAGVSRPSLDLGILQEISNSSLRRKKSNVQDATLLQFYNDQRPTEENAQPQSNRTLDTKPATNAAGYTTIAANSSLPLRTDSIRTPRARSKPSRLASPRKVDHEDTPRYIEQLESQLAALQTKLQSLTSPSTTKTHSAKLRAVTTESRLLRQEVEDWERKFHERISEQLEQHEMVVASLKSQIRTLQRELDASRDRVKDMIMQCAEKEGQILAAEGANYDLERRLEFMSELLALSPTKLNFHSDFPSETRRISAPRPSSSSQFHIPISNPRLGSPQRLGLSHRHAPPTSPESPTRRNSRSGQEINPFDQLQLKSEPSGAESCTELESVTSTSPPRSSRIPFNGRRSISNIPSDDETRVRPTRRMRRFYTGSMGPRSLILPAATHSESQVWSTPAATPHTPQLTSAHGAFSSNAHGLGFKLPISPERKVQQHIRAATWDENEGSARKLRTASVAVETPVELSPPVAFLAESTTPVEDVYSSQSRVTSLGSLPTRNLFDELSRIQREGCSSSERTDADSTRSTVIKRSPSSAQSLASQNDDSPNSTTVLELAQKPAISPDAAVSDGQERLSTPKPMPALQPTPAATLPSRSPTRHPSNPLPPLRSPTLMNRILAFLSYTLAPSTPTVCNVLTNAWSIVTLSRPVLEFRWWLVRLLVGGLRKKRRLKLLATQSPSVSVRGLGMSSAHGLMAGTLDVGTLSPGKMLIRRPRSVSDVSSSMLSDGDSSPVAGADGDGGDADDEDDNRGRAKGGGVGDSAAVAGHLGTMPRPVAWLKFSMTLVFAVGVALRDGPATLFKPARGLPGEGGGRGTGGNDGGGRGEGDGGGNHGDRKSWGGDDGTPE